MELEFTTKTEDQTSILLSNDTELGSDGDNITTENYEGSYKCGTTVSSKVKKHL